MSAVDPVSAASIGLVVAKIVHDYVRGKLRESARSAADAASRDRIERESKVEVDRFLRDQLAKALAMLADSTRDCDERIADAVREATAEWSRKLDERDITLETLRLDFDEVRGEHAECPRHLAAIARMVARLDPNSTPTPEQLAELQRELQARYPDAGIRVSDVMGAHG